MKNVLYVAVGIVIDIPDDTAGVRAIVPTSPLDKLAARLRRESCCGRDYSEPSYGRSSIEAYVATAYRECDSHV